MATGQAATGLGSVGRRSAIPLLSLLACLSPVSVLAQAAGPRNGEQVRIQLDSGALLAIPPDERAGLKITQDDSDSAKALIKATPSERAIPIIYLVVGVLSIPVIWDTIREMLRRDEYGGVLIDARKSPPLIEHDRSIPADIVLFVDEQGHSTKVESRNVSEDLLAKMIKSH